MNYKIAPQLWIQFPESLKTLLSHKSLVGGFTSHAWYKMIIFLALLLVFIMIHFSPKTLKVLGSGLVTINSYFLLCFKTRNNLLCFVLYVLCYLGLSKRFCQKLVSCCVSLQTCAVTSTHPITPNYRAICLAWISIVVFGVLLMCLAEHHLPSHHLQELFHFVYATFRPHVPLFHQDLTYLASQPLIHTPGNTGMALITIHYVNVSLETSRFDHQRLRGHRRVHSLWICIFYCCSIRFWTQAAYTFPVSHWIAPQWNSLPGMGAGRSLLERSVVPRRDIIQIKAARQG